MTAPATAPAGTTDAPAHPRPSRLIWPAAVVGWGLIAFGAADLVTSIGHAADPDPVAFGRWVVGLALVHDLLLAPVVCLAGLAVARLVPARLRAPLVTALLVSALLTAVAWPAVRRWGVLAANPSILPRDYGRNLLVVLGLVWAVAAGWALVAEVRHRRAG